ncbi:MAG: ubiquitin-like protein, partial [Candidatus Fonsibacter sp.]
IKRFIEESEGIPTQFQRLTYNGKKVKGYHTVGYYSIQRESELHMAGRLRGGGKRGRPSTGVVAKDIKDLEELNMLIDCPPKVNDDDVPSVKVALSLVPGSVLTWLENIGYEHIADNGARHIEPSKHW